MNDVASPCIKLCKLDERSMCLGCSRSLAEIARWSQMDNVEKQVVLDAVKARCDTELNTHCEQLT